MNSSNRYSAVFNAIAIIVLQCCFQRGFVMGYIGEEGGVLGGVDVPVPGSNVKGGVSGCHLTSDDPDADCIPGRGGADYPLHWQVPPTHFQCSSQQYPGYYADPDAQCQVFHICQSDGRHDSFLCPNGTVFNQKYFTCEWWYNVNCAEAQSLYVYNAYLYQEPSVSWVQQPGSLQPALPVPHSPAIQHPSPIHPTVPVTSVISTHPPPLPPSVAIVQQPVPLGPAPLVPVSPAIAPLPSQPIVPTPEQPQGTLPSEPAGY